MLVRDVHISHLQNCIENGTIVYAGETRHAQNNNKDSMKNLYNLLFDYAVSRELVDKNYARMFTIDSGYVRKPNSHIPYTEAELDLLWANIDKHPIIDMILIQCYSGWRPGELCDLKMKDVDMDVGTFTGGLKQSGDKPNSADSSPNLQSGKSPLRKSARSRFALFIFHDPPAWFPSSEHRKGEVTQMRYASFSVQLVNEVVPLLSLNSEHKGHDGRITFCYNGQKV